MKPFNHGRRFDARWIRGIAALVCAAGLGLANATTVTLSQFPPNPGLLPGGGWVLGQGTTFSDPPPARAWVNGVYGGVPKFLATDSLVLAGRAGALPIAATSAVGLADAAGAVARCVLGANLACAAGTAAYMAYKAYRAMPAKDVPGGSKLDPATWGSVFDVDPGKAQSTVDGYCGYDKYSPADHCASSLSGVADAVAGYYSKGSPMASCASASGPSVSRPVLYAAGEIDQATLMFTVYETKCEVRALYQRSTARVSTVPYCKGEIDAYDPAYSVPDGSPVGLDGKCPTARGNHVGLTPSEVAQKVVADAAARPEAWAADQAPQVLQGLRDAIDRMGLSVPSDLTTAGPASQNGPTAETTTTTGSGTSTQRSTPSYSYSYNGNQITYNTTTVTTTINNAGDTTTTTTSNGGSGPKPQDPEDPCTGNPNRIGCMELGTAPDDRVPTASKPLTFIEEAVGLPSACPEPVNITVSGHPQVVSYQPTCDAVLIAKPFILASAAFAALFIVLGALRSM